VRRKNIWNRKRGEYIDVIEIQESRWNDANSCNFTINVGVFSASIHEACWGKPAPAFVAGVDCLVRKRLPALQQTGTSRTLDEWWSLPDDVDELGTELRDLLANIAIPWLESFHSDRAIDRYFDAVNGEEANAPVNRLYRAILKWRIGDLSAAVNLLNSFRGKREQAWAERARLVARQIGISTSMP